MSIILTLQQWEITMSDQNRRSFQVPVGLATKMGVYGTSVLAIVALITAVIDGDHTPETLTALATATIILCTTIYGRMKQAAAAYRDAPSPLQGVQDAASVVNAPLDHGSESRPQFDR